MSNDLLKSLFERAKNLILKPAETWEVIAAEETTVPDIYKRWIMPLAAIPAIATFIGYTIIGASALGFTYRVPFSNGLSYAVVSYVLILGAVYVYALILDALAPHFGAEKNFGRAFRVAAYFPVAFWLAGIFQLIPPLSFLSIVGLYSLYLLFVGLPKLMPPEEGKAGGFALASIAVAIVLFAVASLIAWTLLGSAPRDRRSDLAPATAVEERMTARTGAIGRAAQGGDLEDVLAAVLGAGAAGAVVEADALRELAPSRVAGLDQLLVNVEQVDAPIRMVMLTAEYGDDEEAITLRIVNSPVLPALMGAFGFAAASYNRRTGDGFERLRREGDGWALEEWDERTDTGRYGVTRGEAFLVEATGRGVRMRDLERAVERVRRRDLERLPTRDG